MIARALSRTHLPFFLIVWVSSTLIGCDEFAYLDARRNCQQYFRCLEVVHPGTMASADELTKTAYRRLEAEFAPLGSMWTRSNAEQHYGECHSRLEVWQELHPSEAACQTPPRSEPLLGDWRMEIRPSHPDVEVFRSEQRKCSAYASCVGRLNAQAEAATREVFSSASACWEDTQSAEVCGSECEAAQRLFEEVENIDCSDSWEGVWSWDDGICAAYSGVNPCIDCCRYRLGFDGAEWEGGASCSCGIEKFN